jgi:hypothetical protein
MKKGKDRITEVKRKRKHRQAYKGNEVNIGNA